MKIRQKLLLGAVGFSVLIGLVGYISIHLTQESITKNIGNDSALLAKETLDKIDRYIYFRLEELQFLAQNQKLREAVIQSNTQFNQIPSRQAYISQKDGEWVSQPKGAITPFMQQLINNKASDELRRKVRFYRLKYGYDIFAQIFVTNKYGANVAQTEKTTDYKQSDEQWWQEAKKRGLFVGDVKFDESSGTRSLEFGIRVNDENDNFLGVIKAVFNTQEIINITNSIRASSKYITTDIELLTHDGTVIYNTKGNADFDSSAWVLNEFRNKGLHTFYDIMDHPGEGKKLIVHGHSSGYRDYRGLGWFLIIEYNVDEVFASIYLLRNTVFGVVIIMMIIALLAGLFFSNSISSPITQLEQVTNEIRKGEFDIPIDIKSNDEIGFLARAFQEMVDHLKEQNVRVERRTAELSALYEVSNSISYASDYPQLAKLVMESVFKIVDFDICGALLLDGRTANMIIKPSYHESGKFLDDIKTALFEEFSKFRNENIRILSQNVQVVPVETDMETPRGRQFDELKSSFNAPILVSSKVIGMLSFRGVQENIFTADEVKFIYTVTNQLSTAIEHLQEAIKAEKSKMESMIESMLEGVIMLDEMGEVVVLNPQARNMVGLAAEGAISSSTLLEQMKLVNLDIALEESRLTNEVIIREIVMPHNEKRILRCKLSPVGPKEQKIGTMVILRDVTREKEIDSMKTEFISMVSHELRTPLSITKEGLNLILDKVAGDITQKQEMILSAAKDNMDRLSRLINNVLDVSKIEAGKMGTRKERLNVMQLADQVVSSFELKAKQKNIDLRLLFSDKNVEVYADRDKIIQVFTNLINNALKFTVEGSIEVRGKVKDDFIECTVADTGIGISESDLKRTFVKFQQFGRTPGSGEKGTGLGLAIAKGIVEMHDGRIWVESELDVGTKFIFTLPKYKPDLPLQDFVEESIKEAQKTNARMSLLAMTLSEKDASKKIISDEEKTKYLEGMERVLKEGVHRGGDAIFRDARGCFVTLAKCNKEHVDSVSQRYKNALNQYLDQERLTEKVALKMGSATYPNDAKNSRELLKKSMEA